MSRQEIEAFIHAHASFLHNQDIDAILHHYSDASLFWEACGSNLKGKDEIRCWFEAMFEKYHIESINYDIVALRYNQNMASCAVIWDISGCHDEEGDPTPGERVRATYCLEKADQGWRLWHVHGSRW